MSSNKNPYVRGNYKDGFAFMQKKQVFTHKELVTFLMGLKSSKTGDNLTEKAAMATATVLLSPREKDGKRSKVAGSCMGNYSAMGHVYYVDCLKKVKGESKRFRLRYRKVELVPRPRPLSKRELAEQAKKVAKAAKTPKVDKPVKVPAPKKTAPKKAVKKSVKKAVKKETAVAAPVETPVDTAPAVETPVETPVAVVETPTAG